MRRFLALVGLCFSTCVSWGAPDFRARLPEDEIVYFVLPDRFENGDRANDAGGLTGDRLTTGFDPTHKGFYHGGDLKGLTAKLGYIQGLGATAIWLGPIYKNKPVQGPAGQESAGYHGYWITDFTSVDPHFGTEADLRAFVDAAHARGMKVYLDIITNHTADVIQYRECPKVSCAYRSKGDYPYSRRGGLGGQSINAGFAGDGQRTLPNFAKLTDPTFAYTPFVPPAEANVKVPAWLNSPIYYHNRGDSDFVGESSLYGDFFGLDDLMTENPRVVQGFIDIYGAWIDRYGIDGYRIDTARHVNPEFWQVFSPAMLSRARARGIVNFHIFGEVAAETLDVAQLARHTRVDKLPSVLDFGFARAVERVVAGSEGTSVLARLYEDDGLYEGGVAAALRLPTFTGNHDFGRFAWIIRAARPTETDDEVLKRVMLGNAMMFLLRGVPVVYYGDEQGFVGRGVDQDARQDLFASQVASYNDQGLLGSNATTAVANFNPQHPLYAQITGLAKLRQEHVALRRGRQIVRAHGKAPGLLVASRLVNDNRELVLAFNTSTETAVRQIEVEPGSKVFRALRGSCAVKASAPGSYRVEVPPLSYAVCEGTAE
ncbi:MAG TPA: alpha-amylase family glycosyl hydrolase [Steroidobacteraceae bacterium]|jgi:glycosidase|nr:alpha-amylase family glycosyl hydrolase [Steroidobacteraceae bacterium]